MSADRAAAAESTWERLAAEIHAALGHPRPILLAEVAEVARVRLFRTTQGLDLEFAVHRNRLLYRPGDDRRTTGGIVARGIASVLALRYDLTEADRDALAEELVAPAWALLAADSVEQALEELPEAPGDWVRARWAEVHGQRLSGIAPIAER